MPLEIKVNEESGRVRIMSQRNLLSIRFEDKENKACYLSEDTWFKTKTFSSELTRLY